MTVVIALLIGVHFYTRDRRPLSDSALEVAPVQGRSQGYLSGVINDVNHTVDLVRMPLAHEGNGDQFSPDIKECRPRPAEQILAQLAEVTEDGLYRYGFLRGGKRHGLWRTFNPDGELWIECSYADGQLEGMMRTWGPGGQLISEAHYSQGKLHGASIGWYSSGGEAFSRTYKSGILSGVAIEWFESGHIKSNVQYVKGVLTGECTYYEESGDVQSEVSGFYVNDRKLSDIP